jgi:phage shock protein E
MSMKLIVGGVIVVLIAYALLRGGEKTPAADAHRLVEQGALLLDVRTPAEFAQGHIDGAINIAVQELDQRIAELPDKDRTIVLYCRSGARSGRAHDLLKAAGYTSLYDIGAMSNW